MHSFHFVNRSTFDSEKKCYYCCKSIIILYNSAATLKTFEMTNYKATAMTKVISFILILLSKNQRTSLSDDSYFHIISLCTQFADRAPFRRALYVSSHGCAELVSPLPQPPLPLSVHLPMKMLALLNQKSLSLRNQILCCSRR